MDRRREGGILDPCVLRVGRRYRGGSRRSFLASSMSSKESGSDVEAIVVEDGDTDFVLTFREFVGVEDFVDELEADVSLGDSRVPGAQVDSFTRDVDGRSLDTDAEWKVLQEHVGEDLSLRSS